jgi:TonB family protein
VFIFAGAVILAATVVASTSPPDPSDFENPKFFSPNGETCLVIRHYPNVGDFERITTDAYWRRNPIEEWVEAPAAQPEPVRGALYRLWPGDYQQLLSEFASPQDTPERALVADDGHFVTYDSVRCGAKAELLTIHAPDGSVVRTLLAREVFTRNDQQWLCRGAATDVRFSMEDDFGSSKLRTTFLVTDGKWEDAEARHETLAIDLATGDVPASERDLCPAALLVVAEADDGTSPRKSLAIGDQQAFSDPGIIPLASQELLQRAVTRVTPEYPEMAAKVRIAGRVHVDVVVGADGRVEAARVQPFGFGVDEAVKVAIMNWEFAPDPGGVEAARVSGSFVFRFEIVRPPVAVTTIRCHAGSVVSSADR